MTESMFLTDLTARQLLAGYERGDFSPVDVTRATLDRIEAIEPLVNAFVRVDADEALAAAEESTVRWRGKEPRGCSTGSRSR